MVFMLRPDARPTSTKFRPRTALGLGESSGAEKNACGVRARARTPCRDNTAADLLSDWKNARREQDKRVVPSRSWLVLEFAPTLLSASRLCKFGRISRLCLTHGTHDDFSAASAGAVFNSGCCSYDFPGS